jgi:hypothetical protein
MSLKRAGDEMIDNSIILMSEISSLEWKINALITISML